METFIQLVAKDLIRRFGTDLRGLTVVFPNKRAGLFMNQHLAATARKPMWAPKYSTISELFDTLSDFGRCDDIQAVCELYSIYSGLLPDAEPLDRFYGWGEIMLADFDDIDKHLANASQLFSNLYSIKELENDNFLSPRQEEALKHFFEGFSIESNSRLKEKFLSLWNRLGEIYTAFNVRLREEGILYEGALYRDVIEHLPERASRLPEGSHYVFVGFNVLNDVEQKLFSHLQDAGKALFYWDYDVMYVHESNHFEAGRFIRQNLKDFPNALPEDSHDHLRRNPPQVEFVATTSGNAQARYIPQWLQANLTRPEQDTAIVLCDESLLQPVLHSLPPAAEPERPMANITMGFPLTDTPVYGLINALLNLQTDGYDRERHCFRLEQARIVRNHPYASLLPEEELFCAHTAPAALLDYLRNMLERLAAAFGAKATHADDIYQQMHHEALFRAYQIVCRFTRLTESQKLQVQPPTLRRLLRNVMAATTIPFHGEPAVGLQIMGVLETRNLNFRRILMLSVNEGMLPKAISDTSFIPYHLREAFGLTTIQHKIAVYAFYFYRLLQHTEQITFVYNIATDGVKRNEMSRFLRQLLAETDFPITTKILQSGQSLPAAENMEVEKSPEILHILYSNYASGQPGSRPLSPSALNAYIDCPMKFFYQQVAKIRCPKDPQEGLDSALFGTIFHEAAERAYQKLTERTPLIRPQDINALLEGGENGLLSFVDASFLHNFFEDCPEKVFYNGQLIVARKVMASYLRQLLAHDSRKPPFTLKEMEQEHRHSIEVTSGEKILHIDIGGKMDRIDTFLQSDPLTGTSVETLRIVDYKTGGIPETASNMEQLVTPSDRRPSYIFQIFLYAYVLTEEQRNPVSPALFFVHKSHAEDYDPIVSFHKTPVTDFEPLKADFEQILRQVLHELFNPEIPFRQTAEPKLCAYCDYKLLCGK